MPPLNSSNRAATNGARGRAKPGGPTAAKLGMKRGTSPVGRRPASGAAAARPAAARGRAAPTAAAVSARLAPRPAPAGRTSAASVKPAAARPPPDVSRLGGRHHDPDRHPGGGSRGRDQRHSTGYEAQEEQHYNLAQQPVHAAAAATKRPAGAGTDYTDQVPSLQPLAQSLQLVCNLNTAVHHRNVYPADDPMLRRRVGCPTLSSWSSRQPVTPRCSAWQLSTAHGPAAAAAASHHGRVTAHSCSRSWQMGSGDMVTLSRSRNPLSRPQMAMHTNWTRGQSMMTTMQTPQMTQRSTAQPSNVCHGFTSTSPSQTGMPRKQAAASQDNTHTPAGTQQQAPWNSWQRHHQPGTRHSGQTVALTALRTQMATSTPTASTITARDTTLSIPKLGSRCCLLFGAGCLISRLSCCSPENRKQPCGDLGTQVTPCCQRC